MNKKTLFTILKYGASIGILWWLYQKNAHEFDGFLETEKNYAWLLVAVITITFAFFLSYLRWYHLANAIGLKLSVPDAVKLGFIGSFFNVVAFGVVGGDSLRAFYAARHSPDRVPEAILSVFIDRFIGLMVMFGFAAMAWFGNQYFSAAPSAESVAESVAQVVASQTQDASKDTSLADQTAGIGYICTIAGIGCLVGTAGLWTFLFFPGMRNFSLFRWFQKLPKIGSLIERGLDAAALYSKNKRVIIIAACFSLGTNMLFALTIFLVASAVTTERPSLPQHFVIAPISMVANSVPLPGGVGGMEAALSTLYTSYNASQGFIVALGYRLCILFVSLIGWFVWLGFGKTVRTEVPVEGSSQEQSTT